MKRRGALHLARPDWWPPTKPPRAAPGGLIAAGGGTCHARRVYSHACARPCFGWSPRGSPNFLAYSIPKACHRPHFSYSENSLPEVRFIYVFLTSCNTLFYGATCEQLVDLITGLVANIYQMGAIPDTTKFYTKFTVAYNRLSLAHSRAADLCGPKSGRPGVRGRGRGRGRGLGNIQRKPASVNQVAARAKDDNVYDDCSDV